MDRFGSYEPEPRSPHRYSSLPGFTSIFFHLSFLRERPLPAGNDQLISPRMATGSRGVRGLHLPADPENRYHLFQFVYHPGPRTSSCSIDPGGLTDQAEQLMAVIEACRLACDRPVFVFLTPRPYRSLPSGPSTFPRSRTPGVRFSRSRNAGPTRSNAATGN